MIIDIQVENLGKRETMEIFLIGLQKFKAKYPLGITILGCTFFLIMPAKTIINIL